MLRKIWSVLIVLSVGWLFAGNLLFAELGTKKGNGDESKNKNYIRNGSFEETDNNGIPVYWDAQIYGSVENQEKQAETLAKTFSVTTEKAHTGKKSLKLDLAAFDSIKELPQDVKAQGRPGILWRHGFLKDDLNSLKGKEVLLTAWVYYENIPVPNNFCPSFSILIDPLPSPLSFTISNEFLDSQGYFTLGEKTGKWIKIEQEGKIPLEISEGAGWRLQCFLYLMLRSPKMAIEVGSNPICIYIDDISLEVIK